MSIPIQFRRGTIEEWEKHDPILFEAELALVISSDPDIQLMKIGTGSKKWSELPWALRGPRGFDIQYEWNGTSLSVKHSDEEGFQTVDLGIYVDWDGTRLGIKRGIDPEFSYVDLRGACFEYEWEGSKLKVKTSDETDFQGVDLGLYYQWDGYRLGVRRGEDADFEYADLRGASLEFEWEGTTLKIKTTDDAEFPAGVDLKGEKGDTGNPANLSSGKSWAGNEDGVAVEVPAPPLILSGVTDPPNPSGLPDGTIYFKHE